MIHNYIATTLSAAAHLLASCKDEDQQRAILLRTHDMLNTAWSVRFTRHPESKNVKAFWDQVCQSPRLGDVELQVVHGEEVNPPGQRVECYLQKRQKIPSTGTVIWRMPSGFTVRVQLDTVNSRGNRTIRDVHWSRVHLI